VGRSRRPDCATRAVQVERSPPYPMLVMLRIHFMQQWFALADEAVEDALHDFHVYRAIAGIDPPARPASRMPPPSCASATSSSAMTWPPHFLTRSTHCSRRVARWSARAHRSVRSLPVPRVRPRTGLACVRHQAPVPEGEPVVLRHEGAHRCRHGLGLPWGCPLVGIPRRGVDGGHVTGTGGYWHRGQPRR